MLRLEFSGKLNDVQFHLEWEFPHERGPDGFQQKIAASAPFLGERVRELDAWDKIKLLTVRVDRLREWYRDGLLCIGDAAHAMSPIGGVGINLAIQDAVAAANILYRPLQTGSTNVSDALNALPILQSIAAYVVGIGFRPEHVRTPDLYRDLLHHTRAYWKS